MKFKRMKMENQNKKEEKIEEDYEDPTQLEYLINLRAISYDKKSWVYLTKKQKLAFLTTMIIFAKYEKDGERSVTISDLIFKTKEYLDKNATRWSKKYGSSIGNKFSSGAIRLVIFMAIPVFLTIQQKNFPKIIRLTTIARKFIAWQEEDWTNKYGKKIPNTIRWIRKGRIDFVEE